MNFIQKILNGGGVKVPHHKSTAGLQTEKLPIPELVALPMSQHTGAPCEPVVAKGDYVYVGTRIGKTVARVSSHIYSSVSGTVKDVRLVVNKGGRPDTLIEITPDGLQTPDPEIQPPVVTDFETFIGALANSGIVGLGGAGFPTDIKVAPKNLSDIHTLLVNGAECEPYLTTDNREFLECADDVIYGINCCLDYLGIDEAKICIEDNKPDAIWLMRDKTSNDPRISVHVLESRYPQGAQNVLIKNATGLVVPRGARHTSVGVLVLNVTTISSIGKFLKTGMPLVSKRLTVAGDAVEHPKNLEVPIGTLLKDVLNYCGLKEDVGKVIIGGPMMGNSQPELDLPITRQNNGLLAFTKKATERKSDTECIRCGRCVRSCPMGLSPTDIRDAYHNFDAKRLDVLMADLCIGCATCSYVCPAKRALSQTTTLAKEFLKNQKKGAGK